MGILIVVVIICIIICAISVLKDDKSKSKLIKAVNSSGYNISENLDIPNINLDNKPFCFMIDKTNKKWFLADYKAAYANAFDYSEITDYRVSYRLKGTDIIKGENFSGTCSEFCGSGTKILDMVDLNSSNCEHISFELSYKENNRTKNLCNRFVLFEDQQGNFVHAQNHDFVIPSVCISNARDFEKLLFEIVSENDKTLERTV